MPAEELAIWVLVAVALLLVAAMIWRGDGAPSIEKRPHEDGPDLNQTSADSQARSDSRTDAS